jgi:hypothetical protein
MVFDFTTAIKLRNYYKDILIGTPLTPSNEAEIQGIFVCHKGKGADACQSVVDSDFDERFPLVTVKDEKEKDYEVYVYHYDGANIAYHELDKNLEWKGIEKTY